MGREDKGVKAVMDRHGKIWVVEGKRIETHLGAADLEEGIVETTKGVELSVFDPFFVDLVSSIRRGPQILHMKEMGFILAKTGISDGWRVVEGGSGSGHATCFLANAVRPTGRVYSYEIRERWLKLARENVEKCGLSDSVEFVHRDVRSGIEQENLDLVLLDIPDPWLVFPHAEESLKRGGFLIMHVPSTEQILEIRDKIGSYSFTEPEVYDISVRRWRLRSLHPEHTGLIFTGFLVIARRF